MNEASEVRASANALASAFEEYKSVNDQRLSEIERRGSSDVLLNEKLGRMDASINRLQDDVTGVKTALGRPGKSYAPERENKANAAYTQAFMKYVTKGYDAELAAFDTK